MIHVIVGSDTYGRVRAVGKTAIVTSFLMIQVLPVVPLKSYYAWRPSTSESSGIPFLAHVKKAKVHGVPLARIDLISVLFAYMRAVLGALLLFGFIGSFAGLVISANVKPIDDVALTMIRFAEGCLIIGVVGGILTYLVPTTSRRERAIRVYCGEMLGACIDPRRLIPEAAAVIRESLPQFDNADRAGMTRSEYVCKLILARCNVAADARRECEATTDQLLDQLRHFDRAAGGTP
jgi:hypothetical protein